MQPTITVRNNQEGREEVFTPEQALDWLENIGLHAAHEMYSATDVARLMRFMRAS